MGQKSSFHRTIEILKILNDGEKVCLPSLASYYEVSERTIRRDFDLIKEIFGDFIHKNNGCYHAYKKLLLDDVLNSTDLMTLANIINIFDIATINTYISDKTKDLVKNSLHVYHFKSRPFENIKNKEVLKVLEHTIQFNKVIKIVYQNEQTITTRTFNPYKILFINENFYLVGENISKNNFEFLRISLIKEVIDTKKIFYVKEDIYNFIKKIQTPLATIGTKDITVHLRISKNIRRFFILKEYLSSQKILQTYDNGDIEVSYEISNLHEVKEFIIRWLPDIEILHPRSFKKMIKKELQNKLKSIII